MFKLISFPFFMSTFPVKNVCFFNSRMLRVESSSKLEGFTEFEEDILFDVDDPDFDKNAFKRVPIIFKCKYYELF